MGRPFQNQMEFETAIETSKQTASSGVFTGGILTLNATTTQYDVSAGRGIVINDTDPDNPIAEVVTWTAQIGQTPSFAALGVTYVSITAAGFLSNKSTVFDNQDYRERVVLGVVYTQDGLNVNAVGNVAHKPSTYLSSDIGRALGNLNLSGNSFVSAAADLTISKTGGTSFNENSNRGNDVDDPSVSTDVGISGATFCYIYSDGGVGFTTIINQTNIDPDQYDDGTGTLASVAANKYTNQTIYYNPLSKEIAIQYGENIYNSLEEAQLDAFNSPTALDPEFNGEIIRSVLSVKKGTTDLSVVADAFFSQTGKFGIGISGGAGATGLQDMQGVYENSSDPEIITDVTRGALTIRRGTAADTDPVLQIQNGGGFTIGTLFGNGKATFSGEINAFLGFFTNGIESGAYSSTRTTGADTTTSGIDYIVGITDTSVNRTVTLGTLSKIQGTVSRSRSIIIKDFSGAAGTNNITIDTESGAGTIDGVSSVDISVDYGVLEVITDGTNWFTI